MSFTSSNGVETDLSRTNTNDVEGITNEDDTCCFIDIVSGPNFLMIEVFCYESAVCLDEVVVEG